MADIVDKQTRSRMMSGIRGANTKLEVLLRKELFRAGFRYRLHVRGLPGRPDIVFPSRGAVIFVHGCFWHGHDCHLFKRPTTNARFWWDKIFGNRQRDRRNSSALRASGWRVMTIWECAVRGRGAGALRRVGKKASQWLRSRSKMRELR